MDIQVLLTNVAAQIVAGEAVERPASVVKEMVENAIDAGATQISVAIEQGGIKLIRVQDKGAGIPDDQVSTAFSRHATSKLRTAHDLKTDATPTLHAPRPTTAKRPALAVVLDQPRVQCRYSDDQDHHYPLDALENTELAAAQTPQAIADQRVGEHSRHRHHLVTTSRVRSETDDADIRRHFNSARTSTRT